MFDCIALDENMFIEMEATDLFICQYVLHIIFCLFADMFDNVVLYFQCLLADKHIFMFFKGRIGTLKYSVMAKLYMSSLSLLLICR